MLLKLPIRYAFRAMHQYFAYHVLINNNCYAPSYIA